MGGRDADLSVDHSGFFARGSWVCVVWDEHDLQTYDVVGVRFVTQQGDADRRATHEE